MTELDLPDVQRIVLIGFMASGKSAVAAALADRLGWRAIDTDDLIEFDSGRNIPDLFAGEGEPAFRARERVAVSPAAAATAQPQPTVKTPFRTRNSLANTLEPGTASAITPAMISAVAPSS